LADGADGAGAPAANTTRIISVVAGPDGTFHAVVPAPAGQAIVAVPVMAPVHATGWAQQTVTGH
jgi:uncharacterized ion transporter superfamily protein YfcC